MRNLALLVAVAWLCAACTAGDLVRDPTTAALPAATAVPAGVWFRTDDPGTSMLVRAERSLPVDEDPFRGALEELIEGPEESEGMAVVPSDLVVERVRVQDGTAWVDLRGDLRIPDRGAEPTGPTAPLLGLAAITNTLTEFPSVRHVRLQVDGDAELDGWGIPEVLVRDETFAVSSLEASDPMSPLSVFSTDRRVVEPPQPAAEASHLVNIRVIDRLGYVRVAIELAAAGGGDVEQLPVAEAVGEDGAVRMSVDGVLAPDDLPTAVDGPPRPAGVTAVVDHIDVELDGDQLELHVRGPAGATPQFALLTDVSPSRIMLDVKK